jgi:hypothetical protein
MFHLIRFIIWITGIIVVSYFVIGYFGYEINRDYFDQSKMKCRELIAQCQLNILHQGIDHAKNCEYQCVDPQLLIRKKTARQ